MQLPSTRNRGTAGANMTPMIDVVFLLIIFFLVSSHLARQENRLPLNLPVAATYAPVDLDRAPLTISVDTDAQWRVAGDVVELADLRRALAAYQQEHGLNAAVRIRTDGAIAYRDVEPLLRESAKAGITDIMIAVREERAE
tara:strand:+ start:521565 stop:521987 length:423 start_codon:yes stop_codon:yes gene_type:complete